MKTALLIILTTIVSASGGQVTVQLKSGGILTGNLVKKSKTELKIETSYGIVSVLPNTVTEGSWAAAQQAATSKANGKYIQPVPATTPRVIDANISTSAPPIQPSEKSPYDAGFEDGWLVGKHDAAKGSPRNGLKAMRIGKIHSLSYKDPDEQAAYAKGYHEGYHDGWHQRDAYQKKLER